jgi:hypothetical protein
MMALPASEETRNEVWCVFLSGVSRVKARWRVMVVLVNRTMNPPTPFLWQAPDSAQKTTKIKHTHTQKHHEINATGNKNTRAQKPTHFQAPLKGAKTRRTATLYSRSTTTLR